MERWHKRVRVQGWVIRMLLFLAYGGFATWMSFFYVYLKEVPRLSGIEVGAIAAFQQLNNIFVLPVWGYLADRFGRKRMMTLSLGVSTLLIPLFLVSNNFWALLVFMVILTLFYNPLATLLDTVALDFEEQSGGQVNYGQLRLWASVGWAAFALLIGATISTERLHLIFPLASAIFAVTWLLLFFVYQPLRVTRSLSGLKQTAMLNLLRHNPRLLHFLLLLLAYSVFAAPIYQLINLYYHEIGATNWQLGLAFTVQALCELPFFFWGKRIVQRFGARNVFLFTMVVTALRMVGYSLTANPYVAIGLGIFNGVTIALLLVSAVEYVHRMVPDGLRSSGQALIYAFLAVGTCIGSLLIGVLLDVMTIRQALLLEALAILALALLVMAMLRNRAQRAKPMAQ